MSTYVHNSCQHTCIIHVVRVFKLDSCYVLMLCHAMSSNNEFYLNFLISPKYRNLNYKYDLIWCATPCCFENQNCVNDSSQAPCGKQFLLACKVLWNSVQLIFSFQNKNLIFKMKPCEACINDTKCSIHGIDFAANIKTF